MYADTGLHLNNPHDRERLNAAAEISKVRVLRLDRSGTYGVSIDFERKESGARKALHGLHLYVAAEDLETLREGFERVADAIAVAVAEPYALSGGEGS